MPRTKKARAASSAKKARATRRPSTHGGSRAGAGRKREKLPAALIDRLGAPPEEPKKLRAWVAKLLAEVQWGVINGTIGSDLAANIRANAGAIDRVLPVERVAADPDDDDDDEEGDGPELEDASEDDGLRVG